MELMFRDSEREKYEAVWRNERYRSQHDGLAVVDEAFAAMGCQPGDTLIDWGCGTGRAAMRFKELGLDALCFDIAANCLDPDVKIPLVVGALWEARTGIDADYAFCTDVLEHIPEDYVGMSLDMLAARTHRAAFIQVDTVMDLSGPEMKPPMRLHLTVRDRKWWRDELHKRWKTVEGSPGEYSRWRYICTK